MNVFESFADQIDKWNRRLGKLSSWLIFFMVFTTFAIVILRYAFGLGWVWLQETVIYSHGMVFLLGASYTLLRNEHVRVDIFYQKMSPRKKAWIDLLGTIIFLLPVLTLIFYQSLPYVLASWSVFEGSKDGGGLEAVFLQKSLILVFCVSLFLQGVSTILRSAFTLINTAQGVR